MDFSTDWNVNKYYDKTEVLEHWNLRKALMKKYKNQYPEGRLAALAKVFYNIEFLGCQYDLELMKLVQNMSNQVEIIVEYRERKKTKLKRTFVRASDAVKRKAVESNDDTCEKKRPITFVSETNKSNWQSRPENDRMSATQIKKMGSKARKEVRRQMYKVTFPIKNELDLKLLDQVRNQPGIKSKLVLFEKSNWSMPHFMILERSTQKAKLLFKILETTEPGKYELKINDEIIAEYTMTDFTMTDLTIPSSKKKAYPDLVKKHISKIAYDYLAQYCFTVVEIDPSDKETISIDITEKTEKQQDDSFKLSMDSIGAKMMKQMGWGGQGLGNYSKSFFFYIII